MPERPVEPLLKSYWNFVKVFFAWLLSVFVYTVVMTKRLFTIVIHLYIVQYELDNTMESEFFILQMSLLSFFPETLLGSKISKEWVRNSQRGHFLVFVVLSYHPYTLPKVKLSCGHQKGVVIVEE
jgi:hypothetical protein